MWGCYLYILYIWICVGVNSICEQSRSVILLKDIFGSSRQVSGAERGETHSYRSQRVEPVTTAGRVQPLNMGRPKEGLPLTLVNKKNHERNQEACSPNKPHSKMWDQKSWAWDGPVKNWKTQWGKPLTWLGLNVLSFRKWKSGKVAIVKTNGTYLLYNDVRDIIPCRTLISYRCQKGSKKLLNNYIYSVPHTAWVFFLSFYSMKKTKHL